ncbi:MAG TPA: glycosyltransferase family A protein [Longimicrobiaceae bacterium]|nr:glycosyltransferase family A protein [Longimicrobiaceae bacterium]
MSPVCSDPPLVSVVTPCHDAEAFVGETIESVLAQTHPTVEHLLVDDASTDGSWAVIHEYRSRYPDRVRAVRLDRNRGGSHARNVGAALARGDFLMFLDADDLIGPGTLHHMLEALRDPSAGIAVSRWQRLRRAAGRAWEPAPADAPLPDADPDAALRGWIEGTVWAPPCALLWRREAFERTGGWDESLTLNDDGDLAMRALAGGTRIARAEGGVFYRWHDAARVSMSQSFLREEKLRSQVRVLDRLSARLEEQGRLAEFAPSLGLGYQRAAFLGFQNGHVPLARECLRRGEALAGRRMVSPRAVGRALERILGLERKERLVQGLARLGVMTSQRRRIARLHELSREGAGVAAGGSS